MTLVPPSLYLLYTQPQSCRVNSCNIYLVLFYEFDYFHFFVDLCCLYGSNSRSKNSTRGLRPLRKVLKTYIGLTPILRKILREFSSQSTWV
jgi:hypothetical protein